jgi:hypothetical protein
MPNRPDPNVRDLLLARVDEITANMTAEVDEVRTVTEQLHPERARSCRNAITMASVMGLYATKRGWRPLIRATGGVCHSTPQWSRSRSR